MHKNAELICKELDKVAMRGHGFSRVFDDFLGLSCHALAKRDEDYLAIVNGYPNNHPKGHREADFFASAFARWQAALADDYRDYLGEIFQERVTRGENGQFFTPEELCEMLRHMIAEKIEDNARVYDPACGSGRTLLSATRSNRLASFHGIDLDLRCVRMTALNLLCRNVNGTVVWGNTLTLKAHGGYELRRTPLGGELEWFGENRASELIRMGLREAAEEQAKEESVVEEPQYSLGL